MTKFKLSTHNQGSSTLLAVTSNNHRKCLTFYNDDASDTAFILQSGHLTKTANEVFPLPPKSSITFKIPDDNPQAEYWMDMASNESATIYIYEAISRKGQ